MQCESLQELLALVKSERAETTPNGPLTLKPGQVIEIQGVSGTGKTQLVYRLILDCILSSSAKVAVVLDTSDTFDVQRLRTLLGDREEKLLERVLVFHPESTVRLCATLTHLPNVLLARHHNPLDLGLVVVDSISDFYWQDKFIDELHTSLPGPKKHQPTINHAFNALEQLRKSLAPSIVLTNWGLVRLPHGTTGSQKYFKSHFDPYARQPNSGGSTAAFRMQRLPLRYHLTLTPGVNSGFEAHVWSSEESENDHRFDFRLEVTEKEVVVHPSVH